MASLSPSLPDDVEKARLASLASYGVLDSPPEPAYDALVQLAAFVCGTPMAAVSLIAADRQWLKAQVGLGGEHGSRENAFCTHVLAAPDELLQVPDATADSRFAANPLVTGDPWIRFYAGAPLVTSDGSTLGTLCVVDTRPRRLTDDQSAALSALAVQCVALLEARLAATRLLVAANQRDSAAHEALQKRTAALHRAESDIAQRVFRDDLTGLGNRAQYERDVERCSRTGGAGDLAVLLLDLDDFKHVNDSLGHVLGDRLLVEVARRTRAALREDAPVCRLGGDEFVVVLPGVTAEGALTVARRLEQLLREPVQVGPLEIVVSASIGVALRSGAQDAAALLQGADLAMYAAKEQGKSRCVLFEPAMQAAASDRQLLHADLRRAVTGDGLHLVYQPVVDLLTGAMTSVEALVRWEHPTRGLLLPDRFIPLAEDTGLVVPLGEWVLREACRQLRRWDAGGGDPYLGVSVNVSARQLDRPGLVQVLDECLDGGLDPRRLTLEITETLLAVDHDTAMATLHDLRSRGVQLSIDDFGTGHSSLERLRSAPVSQLKVDRAFVREIVDATTRAPIVSATVGMAHDLGFDVVAEGVETRVQLDHLRALGCPSAQGYLLDRPLRPGAVPARMLPARPWAHLLPGAVLQA